MLVLPKTKITNPRVCLVACLHGNELFGQRVVSHLSQQLGNLPELKLIVANEEAMKRNVRFVDTDLNRSFPGDAKGNIEERLASQLIEEIQGSQHVLDIHTTSSDIDMVAIVPNLGPATRRIVNLTSQSNVVEMVPELVKKSLIGNVDGAVSLEFGESYASSQDAIAYVESIVRGLLAGDAQAPKPRDIYHVVGVIPNETKLPSDATNFVEIPKLNITPFLADEREYKDYQGFNVVKTQSLNI